MTIPTIRAHLSYTVRRHVAASCSVGYRPDPPDWRSLDRALRPGGARRNEHPSGLCKRDVSHASWRWGILSNPRSTTAKRREPLPDVRVHADPDSRRRNRTGSHTRHHLAAGDDALDRFHVACHGNALQRNS